MKLQGRNSENFWSLCFKLYFILICFSLHLHITNMLVHTHSSIPLSLNHMCIHTPQQMHTHTHATTTKHHHHSDNAAHVYTQARAHTLFSFTSHTWHLFMKGTKTAGRCWRMGETYPSWSIIEPTVFLLAFFSMKDLWTTSHIQR